MFDKLIGIFYSVEGIGNLVLFKDLKIEVLMFKILKLS